MLDVLPHHHSFSKRLSNCRQIGAWEVEIWIARKVAQPIIISDSSAELEPDVSGLRSCTPHDISHRHCKIDWSAVFQL